MRTLIQRVNTAKVVVGDEVVGQIQKGILALVGVGCGDKLEDATWIAKKLLNLRIFENNDKPWSGSVISSGYSILLVSQFTLHASCRKTKPSFQRAMGGEEAKALFDAVVSQCKEAGVKCETGQFGAMMDVTLTNEGPVTFWIDSKNRDDIPFGASSSSAEIDEE